MQEDQGIYTVELYLKVRLACSEGMTQRAAAKHFNISRDSVRKMLSYSTPPGLCALSGHRFTVAIGDSKGHESVGIEFNAV